MFPPAPASTSNPLTSAFDQNFTGTPFSPLELTPHSSLALDDRLSSRAVQSLSEAQRGFSRKSAIAGLQAKPTGGGSDSGVTSGGSGPDLVVSRLSLSRISLNAGDSLSLFATIANQGNVTAGSSQTGFYLSRDQVLDGTDPLLGTVNLGTIRRGSSAIRTFSTTLDQGLEGGTYYLIAQADRRSQVAETNENNNVAWRSIQIIAPAQGDLVSQGITVSDLTDSDTTLSLDYQIANLGTATVDSSIANVYLSPDAVFDTQDPLLATVNIAAIAPGGISQQSLNHSLEQPLTPSTYYLFVQADGANQILESNEANNLSVASFTVTAPEPPPVEDNWFTQNLQDSGLKLLGSSLGADNVLSRQDMIQLFTHSQDDGAIDATELADLSLILSHGQSLFAMEDHVYNLSGKILNGDTANVKSGIGNLSAGSSSTQMASLVDKWFLGKDRPDTQYQYGYAAGAIVVDGFSVADVRQGNAGDCYFLTSLSSIAENQSRFLQEMFIDNGDETFTVKFYDPKGNPTYVTVDRYLPSNSQGKFVYANIGELLASDGNELWVALAEKAYAQLAESGWSRPNLYKNSAYNTNSYQAIDTGWMNEAIAALTALKTYNYQLSPKAGLTESNLLSLLNSDRLLTIGFGAGQGLVWDNHAYSINGYNSTDRTFHLDNSWGYGDVALTFSQLQSLGGRLQYSA